MAPPNQPPTFHLFTQQAENPSDNKSGAPAPVVPNQLHNDAYTAPPGKAPAAKGPQNQRTDAPAAPPAPVAPTPDGNTALDQIVKKTAEFTAATKDAVDVRTKLRAELDHARDLFKSGDASFVTEYAKAIQDMDKAHQLLAAEHAQVLKGVQDLDNALKTKSANDPARQALAKERDELSKLDSTLHDLERFSGYARARLGMSLISAGKVDEGMTLVKQAQQLDPEMKSDTRFQKHWTELTQELAAKGQTLQTPAEIATPQGPVQNPAQRVPAGPGNDTANPQGPAQRGPAGPGNDTANPQGPAQRGPAGPGSDTANPQGPAQQRAPETQVTGPLTSSENFKLPSGDNRPGANNFDDPRMHAQAACGAMLLSSQLENLKGKKDTDTIAANDGSGNQTTITVAQARQSTMSNVQKFNDLTKLNIPTDDPDKAIAALHQVAQSEKEAALKSANAIHRDGADGVKQQIKDQQANLADITQPIKQLNETFSSALDRLPAPVQQQIATLHQQLSAAGDDPDKQQQIIQKIRQTLPANDGAGAQALTAFNEIVDRGQKAQATAAKIDELQSYYESCSRVRAVLADTMAKTGDVNGAKALITELPKYTDDSRAKKASIDVPTNGDGTPGPNGNPGADNGNPAANNSAPGADKGTAAPGAAPSTPDKDLDGLRPEQLIDRADRVMQTEGIAGAKKYYERAIQLVKGNYNPEEAQIVIDKLQTALKSGKKEDGSDVTPEDRKLAHAMLQDVFTKALAPIRVQVLYAQTLKENKQYAEAEKVLQDAIATADKLPIAGMKAEYRQIKEDLKGGTLDPATQDDVSKLAANLLGRSGDDGAIKLPITLRKDMAVFYLGIETDPKTHEEKVGAALLKPEKVVEQINQAKAKEKEILGIDLDKDPGKDPRLMTITQTALANMPENLKKQIQQANSFWNNAKEDTVSGATGLLVAAAAAYFLKNPRFGALVTEAGELSTLGRVSVAGFGLGGSTLTRAGLHRYDTGEWENPLTSGVHGGSSFLAATALFHGGNAVGNKVFGLGAEGAGIDAQVARLTTGTNGLKLTTLSEMNSLGQNVSSMVARSAPGIEGSANLSTLGTLATDGVKLAGNGATVEQLAQQVLTLEPKLQAAAPTANLASVVGETEASILAQRGITTVEQLNSSLTKVKSAMETMNGIGNTAKLGDVVKIFGTTGAERVSLMSKVLGGAERREAQLAAEQRTSSTLSNVTNFLKSPLKSTANKVGSMVDSVTTSAGNATPWGAINFETATAGRLNWTRNWQGYTAATAAYQGYRVPTTLYDQHGTINPATGKPYGYMESLADVEWSGRNDKSLITRAWTFAPLQTAFLMPFTPALSAGSVAMRTEGFVGHVSKMLSGDSAAVATNWGTRPFVGARPLMWNMTMFNSTEIMDGLNRRSKGNDFNKLLQKTQAPIINEAAPVPPGLDIDNMPPDGAPQQAAAEDLPADDNSPAQK